MLSPVGQRPYILGEWPGPLCHLPAIAAYFTLIRLPRGAPSSCCIMPVWSITPLVLPLRYVWKISRNASTTKTNLLVRIEGSGRPGQGEAAPNVRYGET